MHPVVGPQLSVVQALLSSHTPGGPGWHTAAEQTSPVVQALLSLQGLVLGTPRHAPLVGLQVSFVQTLLSLQFLGVPAQAPSPSQTSVRVQALPSLQVVLFCRSKVWQAEVNMLQASNSQPSRPNAQKLPTLKLQTPAPLHTPSQESLKVVGRHAALSLAGMLTQAPFRHEF